MTRKNVFLVVSASWVGSEPLKLLRLSVKFSQSLASKALFIEQYKVKIRKAGNGFSKKKSPDGSVFATLGTRAFYPVLQSRSQWIRNYLGPGAGAGIKFLINMFCSQFGGC